MNEKLNLNNATVLSVLRDARALIATSERWTKGAYAKTAAGMDCGVHDPGATCFCAHGAVLKAATWAQLQVGAGARHALDAVLPAMRGEAGGAPTQYAPFFNDAPETTHADVLAAFDRAIAREETKERVAKLKAARELIAKPGGWTKGHYARDASGALAASTDEAATCFCAVGAVLRVNGGNFGVSQPLLEGIAAQVPTTSLPVWNDAMERTQAEVVAAYDAAIAAEEAKLAAPAPTPPEA